MKKLLMLSIVLVFAASAFAQTDSTKWDKSKQELNNSDSTFSDMADGYVKKDGQMMSLKDGELEVMKSDITLSNGTLVTSTGNYKLVAGTTTTLKEGSHIDMLGKITLKRDVKINEENEQNDNDGFMMPDGIK